MMLGISTSDGYGTYLGLPCLIGISKKEIFQFFKDRLWKKLNGMKENILSQAGRVVLSKNVVQAIPPYSMSCFLLPVNVIRSLYSMVLQFFWGESEGNKKLC